MTRKGVKYRGYGSELEQVYNPLSKLKDTGRLNILRRWRATRILELCKTGGNSTSDIASIIHQEEYDKARKYHRESTIGPIMTPAVVDNIMGEEAKRLERAHRNQPAVMRQLELERLNHMMAAVWGAATSGDIRAIETILKIMARRARYQGLDVEIPQDIDTVQKHVFYYPDNQRDKTDAKKKG